MNTNVLLPLTAATLFALCAGSMVLSQRADSQPTLGTASTLAASTSAPAIVDLPTVSVRPDPADLAYFEATGSQRVVDLPAVTVHPDMADLAYYHAAQGAQRVVTLAAVTVRPAADDLAYYLAHQAGQVADIETRAVQAGTRQIDSQIARAGSIAREVATR